MSKPHYFMVSGETPTVHPVRLGAGNAKADNLTNVDEGKLIKLVGESRYDLCAAGDVIEGWIYGIEPATSGGYTVGGRVHEKQLNVVFDGLQATPGTGAIAVGDYVVAGSITAKGTKLASFPKVCKATDQAAAKANPYAWRVMSLGVAGSGAVGTAGVIERVR